MYRQVLQRHVNDSAALDGAMTQGLISGGRLVERETTRDQVVVVDDAARGQVDDRRQILSSTRAVGSEDRLRTTYGAVDLNLGGLATGTQADRHHASTVGENIEGGAPRGGNAQCLEGDVNTAPIRQLEDLFAGILGHGVNRRGRAERLDGLELVVCDIDGDNLGGPEGAGDLHDVRADAPPPRRRRRSRRT